VTDYAGISTSQSRSYTAQGMTMAYTDSRGNTTTEVYDTALRLLSVTDAAENSTSYAYGQPLDQPTCITDAMGKTACYAYDARDARRPNGERRFSQPCSLTTMRTRLPA
jgi:YD repeat-containing protein